MVAIFSSKPALVRISLVPRPWKEVWERDYAHFRMSRVAAAIFLSVCGVLSAVYAPSHIATRMDSIVEVTPS